MKKIIDSLFEDKDLSDKDFIVLINNDSHDDYLFQKADTVRQSIYGTGIYIRGLIEFSNYCKNNCYYCGIRSDNKTIERYRLEKKHILDCCSHGYELGFRTFVLQGGEDYFYSEELIKEIIIEIKSRFIDCAISLSMGERSFETYNTWFQAGANRYLLRHETANSEHYKMLHPAKMTYRNRIECLYSLKKIGYQVGSGFMVGSPFQTTEILLEDLRFLQLLQPEMIGIGPFISHHQTPFHKFPNGDYRKCLRLISIIRLMFPYSLIPATTALATINKEGREKGLLAGANVIMPNLSPKRYRKKYQIYDNKICTEEEAAESLSILKKKVETIGYSIVSDIGHAKKKVLENDLAIKGNEIINL